MFHSSRKISGSFLSLKKFCLVMVFGCLGTSLVFYLKYIQGVSLLHKARRSVRNEDVFDHVFHSKTTTELIYNATVFDTGAPKALYLPAVERVQQKLNESLSHKAFRPYFTGLFASSYKNQRFYDSDVMTLCGGSNPIYVAISGGADGRLGNRMFQYASLLGISAEAKKHGNCVFPVFEHKSHLFSLFRAFQLKQIRNISAMNITTPLSEEKAMAYSSKISAAIKPVYNYTIRTYLQSWKYFRNIFKIIRQEFQFQVVIYEEAGGFLFEIAKRTSPNTTFIGVHIRRGDMAIDSSIKRGYTTADEQYIDKALKYYRAMFSNVSFVVCSDDLIWAFKKVNGSDVFFSRNHTAEVDMAILSMCDHSIITSGSFGWWSAWLAGGIVVYYKYFPAPGSWLDSICDHDDYYPTNWLGMS